MASSFNTHHTTSWSWMLLLLALFVAILTPLSHAILTNSSKSGASSFRNLQFPARCRPEQAAALLQMKRSFTFTGLSGCPEFPANTTLPSWREGTDCCLWEGVSCDHFSGSVIGIDLSSRSLGIGGGLHPALFSLTSLKQLKLDYNDFCGSHLPESGFERLIHLEDLSLWNCNLSGQIPPTFSGLHSLKTISLGSNNFNGSTFPLGITHLRNLKVLDFQSMSLSGPIPNSIGNLSSLRKLYLSSNQFSGSLPRALSNLTQLSQLECLSCGLSGRVPSLSNLSRLKFVDLAQNNLEENVPYEESFEDPVIEDFEQQQGWEEGSIPLSDGQILPNLQELNLMDNSFTGTVNPSLFTQPSLQYLDLSQNYLSGHIEVFQNPSATLTEISLFDNKLSGTIPFTFANLRALTDLSLDNNSFMGTLDLYPYLMLRNLSSFSAANNPLLSVSVDDRDDITNGSITYLDFASCSLSGLPNVIKYLPELDQLDLSNNSIQGNIPDWIWRNMSLLFLQQNLFTNVGQIPAYTTICALDLSFNKLRGPVPFPYTGKILDYSNNNFTSIPPLDFLRQFRVTKSMNLANNKIRGHIPYAECHQDNVLEVLDLSGNNLSGPVPPYLLKGCGNGLGLLNLRNNHLNGTWPDEMGESCYLEVIDLHGNQMPGSLPRSLAGCNLLRGLDVGGNKFVDVFPTWLGNLIYLRLLVLRSNQFYGPLTIPFKKNHSMVAGYFPGLQILDLAGNGFNGVLQWELFDGFKSMVCHNNNTDDFWGAQGNQYISDTLHFPHSAVVEIAMKQQYLSVPNLPKDLVVIDLSNNRFIGSIPKTIGNMQALHVLNMSHNSLSGNIPVELGRLSNVESLDLSWNNLSGNIPQALASLTSLEVLNLSYNDLSGSIPSGRQFSTFPASSFEGGNQGLYGCPLPVRCNLTKQSPGSSILPPQGGASATDHRLEVAILCLFIGSGYGVGIAVAIVLQMACCGKCMKKALKRLGSLFA